MIVIYCYLERDVKFHNFSSKQAAPSDKALFRTLKLLVITGNMISIYTKC